MIRKLGFFLLGLFFSSSILASTGITVTAPLITKDPQNIRGGKLSLWYQPESFIWNRVRVFFDVGYGHWWVNGNFPQRQINIISAAPTLRFFFTQNNYFSTFIDASIGPSYLSEVRIGKQKLGIHFAFQDQLGLGALIGKGQRFAMSLSAMHYSNASIARKNAGITIPLLINVGYRF